MVLSSAGNGGGGEPTNASPLKVGKDWTVEAKLAQIPETFETQTSSPVPFFHLLERLKTTKRAGWVRSGIPDGESISDHMYRMSIMTMLAPQTLNVDLANCMRMALIHDMAEALVGDIIPDENVPKRDKSKAERDTMEYIAKQLLPKVGNGLTGMDILKIWDEYEMDETVDAHFVHDVDKMELMLQLLEYEKRTGMFLDEYNGVEKGIRSAEVKEWCDEVQKDREQLRLAKGLPSHLAKAT